MDNITIISYSIAFLISKAFWLYMVFHHRTSEELRITDRIVTRNIECRNYFLV